MPPKSERFEMRLDEHLIGRIDDWRSNQPDLPSRSEAARALIDRGLDRAESRAVETSDAEKLSLTLLSEIHDHLGIENGIDPKLVMRALYGGHTWGIKWEYQALFPTHEDRSSAVSEVVDFLDMWRFIESGYGRLSKAAKKRVATEVKYSMGEHVEFYGFDGNYESEHLNIAAFMIKDLDRFREFQGRELNSHAPTLERYRSMFECFEPMREHLGGGRDLSEKQIIQILNAGL